VRVLCLDIGERRIGVATGDTEVRLARPLTTIVRRSWERDVAALRRLQVQERAEALIIGLPISLDGQLHQQGERVRAEGERLGEALGLPVTFWDERFSTMAAEERLRAIGTAYRKNELDAAAAAVILQSYFDQAKNEDNACNVLEG
jgi:putative Holliday junction resolvase